MTATQSSSGRRFLRASGLALLLGVAATVLALLWSATNARGPWRSSRSPAAEPLHRDVRSAPQGDARKRRGLGLAPGDVLRYRLRLDQTSRSALAAADGRGVARSSLTGLLFLRVRASVEGGWLVSFRLADTDAQVTVHGRSQAASTLRALDDVEIHARLGTHGTLVGLVFPASLSAADRLRFLRVLGYWTFVLSDDPAAASWEVVEEDVLGHYSAQYVRRESCVSKAKRAYVESRIPGERLTVEASAVRFVLDPAPARIEGSERILLERDSGESIRGDLSVSFVREAYDRSAGLDPLSPADRAALLAAAGDALASAVRPLDAAAALHALQDDLGRLDRLVAAGGGGSEEASQTCLRIIALLRQSPSATEPVLERLRGAACGNELAALLLACLGAGGTRAAQEGLIEILRAPSSAAARRQSALAAFLSIPYPHPMVDEVLRDPGVGDAALRDQALLVLGAMADRIRDRDPDRFGRLAAHVTRQVAGAPRDRMVAALQAVGNLGPDAVPAVVLRARESEDPTVRMAVARALRKIRDPEAEALLRRSALEDPDPGVRRFALKALLDRARLGLLSDPVDGLLARAAEDSAEVVRTFAQRVAHELHAG